MGSAGGLGALRAPLAGFGAEPQPKSNLLPFSLKISHQVATISIIFNEVQSADHKLQSQKYLGRQCLPLPLIKSAYGCRLAVPITHTDIRTVHIYLKAKRQLTGTERRQLTPSCSR